MRHREVEVRRRTALLKVAQEEREKEVEHCKLWRTQLSLLVEDLPCAEEGRSLVDINLQVRSESVGLKLCQLFVCQREIREIFSVSLLLLF